VTVVFAVAVILFLWRFFRKRRAAADPETINGGLKIED
jgi:hypothetical protein